MNFKSVALLLLAALVPAVASAARPQVGGGGDFTFFLPGGGTPWAVGANDAGQLGDGSVAVSPPLFRATGAALGVVVDAVQIAGGQAHGIALKRDGTVYTWGHNAFGQLGQGDSGAGTDRPMPTKVSFFDGLAAGNEVIAVAAGAQFSAALTRQGYVYAWGSNADGQLGVNSNNQQDLPVAVIGALPAVLLTGITQISAGSSHMLALKPDGTVLAWGDNSSGQLGDASNSDRSTPVAVGGLSAVTRVVAGGEHGLALKADGTVQSWGRNLNGQLGSGDTSNRNVPGPVLDAISVTLAGVADIAAGSAHSLAAMSDGSVYSWGKASQGQLGNNDTANDRLTADPVAGISGATGVFAPPTADRSLVHVSNATFKGALLAFGDNGFAELGIGSNAPSKVTTPTLVTQAPIDLGAKAGRRTNFKAPGVSRSDVLWRNAAGANVSWDFTGGAPASLAAAVLPGVDSSWSIKATADVNGDGVSDAIWFQASTGQVAIWLMANPSTIKTAVFVTSVGAGSGWTIQGAGDLDGDGRDDIAWRNTSTGELLVWYMKGEGAIDQAVSFGVVPLSYELKALADVNGDWIMDLVWFNATNGQVVVWQMAQTGTYTARFPAAVGASAWRILRVGDFDGDGRDDILWRDTSNGTTAVWYMNGGTIAQTDFPFNAPVAIWTAEAPGDYDGDARDDALWISDLGVVMRWLMQGRGVTPIPQVIMGVGAGWATAQ